MASFALTNFKWGSSLLGTVGGKVTWSFATASYAGGYQYDAQISDISYQTDIRRAFDTWEAVGGVDFVESTDSFSIGIRLGWDTIDGANRVVGEARYQGISDVSFNAGAPRYSITKAEIRFDSAERWSTGTSTPFNSVSFYSVALHEIGHAIGLDHSTVLSTIMYPLNQNQQALGAGDILGITSIYGGALVQASLIKGLFAANSNTAMALSAAYQMLFGGLPNQEGFKFLIENAVSTNFGAGPGPTFNAENIYINLTNNLVQGNTAAKAAFAALVTGTTLTAKVTSLYEAIIPVAHQKAEGLAFITRPDGLVFYSQVAAERGVAGTDGAAIVAMASLLKIAADQNIGIGNAVRDLLQAVAAGSDFIPVNGTVFTPIETADGIAFDGDDASAGTAHNGSGALISAEGLPLEVQLIGTSEFRTPDYF
jgi:hypothetical protein